MERIGKQVERNLVRAGGEAGAILTEVTSVWSAVVGAGIARNAWPLRTSRDGTLHVATTSATWAFELDRMAPELVESLSEKLGERAPKQLRFRPGPVPEPGADARPRKVEEVPEATPEVMSAALSVASSIEDPELRELVARAARASLARARSDRGFW